MDLGARQHRICGQARALGRGLCAAAPADAFPEFAQFSTWLQRGYAGEMNYLRAERRADPRLALDDAQRWRWTRIASRSDADGFQCIIRRIRVLRGG
jgi:hypothetical protein